MGSRRSPGTRRTGRPRRARSVTRRRRGATPPSTCRPPAVRSRSRARPPGAVFQPGEPGTRRISTDVSTGHAAAVCERVMVTDEPRTTTFEEFFLVEYPRLVPMLTAWCGDRETARDLAQDALVQAEARWTDVAVLDNPGAWVRRVALNRSSNEARRRRREAAAVGRLGRRAADPTADARRRPTPNSGGASGASRGRSARPWCCGTSTTSRSPTSRSSSGAAKEP